MIKDKNSAEWQYVVKFCEARIAEMRADNDGDMDEKDTARLRGKIEFAKEVLALADTPIKIMVQDQKYIDD